MGLHGQDPARWHLLRKENQPAAPGLIIGTFGGVCSGCWLGAVTLVFLIAPGLAPSYERS